MYRKDLLAFAEARVLRIFPGLIAAVLFTSLVVGGITSTFTVEEYYQHNEVYSYIIRGITLIGLQHHLPGVFENNVWPGGVNGSLWTLPVEMFMYIMVAVAGVLKILNSRKLFIAGLLGLTSGYYIFLYGYYMMHAILFFCFALGSFMYINRDIVLVSIPVLLLMCLATILSYDTELY